MIRAAKSNAAHIETEMANSALRIIAVTYRRKTHRPWRVVLAVR
jgi:hypothetical protein